MDFVCANGVWNCPVAPMQQAHTHGSKRPEIPMVVAQEAYKEYAAKYGSGQSLERLNERGGFGAQELSILLYERIKRLESAK